MPLTRPNRGAAPRRRVAAMALPVLVAALIASGAPTPASAQPPNPESAVTGQSAAPTADPLQLGLPWWESLDARWTWENAAPLPSTTTTLSVTIPPELFEFDSAIDAVIVGAQRDPVPITSIDVPNRTVTVAIPEGYFATAAPSMTSGLPRFSLGLRTSRPRPEDLITPPYQIYDESPGAYRYTNEYYSNGYVSIGFDPGPAGATEHSRTVDVTGAIRYNHFRNYWLQPSTEVTLQPGGSVVVSGVPTPTSELWSDFRTAENSTSHGTASPAGDDSVLLTLASADDLYVIIDRSGALRVTFRADRTRIGIGVAAVVVHDASAGPGVTTRIGGWDRFAGAIASSRHLFENGSTARPPVVLASGGSFADALSAAAATTHIGGSLLLVHPTDPRSDVGEEAARLRASSVTAVGGRLAMSDPAVAAVRSGAALSESERIDGRDRYEVSRATLARFWPDGADTIFVATGQAFPDALSAISAAATQAAPVLLVPGTQGSLDASTLGAIVTPTTKRIVIVGGTAAVSRGIERQLEAALPGAVERISGADRFEVSAAVNARFFPSADEAFLATGGTFADALAGGVLAASRNAPLLLVRTDCVPPSAHAALTRWNVEKTTLLGGRASVGREVEDLVPCG